MFEVSESTIIWQPQSHKKKKDQILYFISSLILLWIIINNIFVPRFCKRRSAAQKFKIFWVLVLGGAWWCEVVLGSAWSLFPIVFKSQYSCSNIRCDKKSPESLSRMARLVWPIATPNPSQPQSPKAQKEKKTKRKKEKKKSRPH